MTPKIQEFLATDAGARPCLVVDLNVVEENFDKVQAALPAADLFYAVKANPAPEVLKLLAAKSSFFDAASIYEIRQCFEAGATADRISFGNTLKKPADIKAAYDLGIDLFAFDAEEELEKLAKFAPGTRVYCRILVENRGADWPLSRKFGCESEVAAPLLLKARDLGLKPYGLSFHVGSQQTWPHQWDFAVVRAAVVVEELKEQGIEIGMLNIGGGFPTDYREEVQPLDAYGEAIMTSLERHLGENLPRIVIEPGRSVVAHAGIIESEVVLVSKKSEDATDRWVYLDIGIFGGLAEAMGEAICYAITTEKDGGPVGPVNIAGPTCDGMDIIYEKSGYELPLALQGGDKVIFHSAGAYTSTYCSTGFNGFPPLREVYL